MTRWLDDDEMRAWRALVDVHADVFAALDADLLEQHGLTEGEYAVLVHLSEAPDRRLRMCDLANRLHLSASGLTRRLDGLVSRGFVAREAAPDDRRVTLAALTPKGRRKLEQAAPDHVGSVRRHLLDHLTRAQVRQLADALGSVQRGQDGSSVRSASLR
jgi:DNA-binding MarR family transcriptional regulator